MTSLSADAPSPISSTSSILEQPPTLEQLVSHFVASKRSLASITHVWRANEIVTAARAALEENAVLNAENAFIRRAVDEQVNALEAIRHGVEQTGVECEAEFKSVLQSLDLSSARLQTILNTLRTTPVEPSFRPVAEEPKHLYDFVDETGVSDLNSALRASIDRFNAAHSTLADALDAFDAALNQIHHSLSPEPDTRDADTSSSLPTTQQTPSPLPSLFHDLEAHATDSAELLSSLVRHYDLCLTALKHTSGGAEAITQAANAPDVPDTADLPANIGVELASLDDKPEEPLSASERVDMLAVLARDAAEVDDVVVEIGDRVAEMEEQLSTASAYVSSLHHTRVALNRTLALLKRVGLSDVSRFVGAAAEFAARWEEEKLVMAGKTEELEALEGFYEGFLGAYEGLLEEVERRRVVRGEMERVVKEAMERVERIRVEDEKKREAFRRLHGEFLPSDIWPGLMRPSVGWEVRCVGEDEEGEEVEGALSKSRK